MANQIQEGGPFTVSWGYCNENFEEHDTFEAALAQFRVLSAKLPSPFGPALHGDGLDGDCDGDGFFMCSDGLSEEQRERTWLFVDPMQIATVQRLPWERASVLSRYPAPELSRVAAE